MQKFPSVIRTEYAYALLYEHDIIKAENIWKRFCKCKKNYPYPADNESEEELIELVNNINNSMVREKVV